MFSCDDELVADRLCAVVIASPFALPVVFKLCGMLGIVTGVVGVADAVGGEVIARKLVKLVSGADQSEGGNIHCEAQ